MVVDKNSNHWLSMSSSQPNCFLSVYFQVSLDVVGLVDEWAARFFEELDYVNEGENGNLFAEMMKKDLPQVSLMTSSLDIFFVAILLCTMYG